MRFDDTLDTVLASDLASGFGAQSAWRQLIDLIGRGRVAADARALSVLTNIRDSVPAAVRAASARALAGASPPLALVRLFTGDEPVVATAILRDVRLSTDDWEALLPALAPASRAVLRSRKDLEPEVKRALASFGSVDFVLSSDTAAVQPFAPEPPVIAAQSGPFQSLGAIARGLPIVTEALRRREAEPPRDGPALFRIADVVARIEAFQKQQDDAPREAPATEAERAPPPERLSFETDAGGVIRWVEGAARGAAVGIAFARAATPGEAGVDGVVAGAFRKRSRFVEARLMIGGGAPGAGLWIVSATPCFNAANGRFTGYRGVGRRPRAEETPGGAPSADSLRQLVHELRTPTNAIAGFAEMMEHQMLGPVDAPYRDQAIAIRGDARGLLSAIDDLDIAARIEAGALSQTRTSVALLTLVRRVVEELQPLAKTRGAVLAADGDAAQVEGDERGIERAIARLVATMVDAAAPGERFVVRVTPAGEHAEIAVDRAAALSRDDAQLFVEDAEGSSIALLGTGFALRLVRNLARELGGTLAVAPRVLTLQLPMGVTRVMGQSNGG